jgi:hypothetical protein
MPKNDEYHLTIQQAEDGGYTILEGLPSEHRLKSWGAHRYELGFGTLTLWLVGCTLNAQQAMAAAQDVVDNLWREV